MRTARRAPNCLAGLVLAAVLGDPSAAWAQNAAIASMETIDLSLPGMKSEGTATMLSLVGTVVPTVAGIALIASEGGGGSEVGGLLYAYGVYFGPATGYWYAGAPGRGFAGVGVRLGISLVGYGLVAAADSGNDGWGLSAGATVLGIATLAGLAISMIYDIASVDDEVRDHNAEVSARQAGSRLSITPLVSPVNGGTVGVLGRLQL